ncbi:MAG: biotin-dependent carboxyltransferase family protein [Crocinitomicaceae bacterium]
MIEVIQPGLYTSIQDLGRFGYRKYGVPVSGAMDQNSAKLANQILGNSENAALLEVTLIGPTLTFTEACEIAITGAEFEPTLNDSVLQNNAVISIEKGSILKFGAAKKGMRAYLAIASGFDSEMVMGSASFYSNLTKQSHLKKGDRLFFRKEAKLLNIKTDFNEVMPTVLDHPIINVFKGPEFDLLLSDMQDKLLNSAFTVSNQSNRMGCRLIGEYTLSAQEIITAPVLPGTVQLTPSGQLIILGRDAQTTGGYARVLQLTDAAQNCLGQANIGDLTSFSLKL